MRLTQISRIMKPITLSMGIATTLPIYSAVDNYSGIYSTITDKVMFDSVKQADSENFMDYAAKLRFQTLHEKWLNDTRFVSSVGDVVNHDAFKAIVSMGEDAVPYILEEISSTPSTLVWALNFIYKKKISSNPNTTISEACKLWEKELNK